MKQISLLILTLLAIALPASADVGLIFAYQYPKDTGSTLYYKVTSEDAKTVEVTFDPSYLKMEGAEVPETVYYPLKDANGKVTQVAYTVTAIAAKAFDDCAKFTRIKLPDTIEEIGDYAFALCDNKHLHEALSEFKFPPRLKRIGNYAFRNNHGLYDIEIPASVEFIGSHAFYSCTYVTTENDVIHYKGCLTNVTIKNANVQIGESAFSDNKYLKSIKIGNLDDKVDEPKGHIGDGAFLGCSNLIEAIVGYGIVSIGDRAFESCGSTSSDGYSIDIQLAKSVRKIGNEAFSKANIKLGDKGEFVIPGFIEEIGSGAFKESPFLKHPVIEANIKELPDSIFFGCGQLESFEMPSVTKIGKYAFAECSNLTNLEIPNEVQEIGEGTFMKDRHLISIKIPNNVTVIGDLAFNYCDTLPSIEIPKGVSTVGNGAFAKCSSLTSVTIQDGVRVLGDSVFADCKNLSSINIGASVTDFGAHAFANCAKLTNESVKLPSSLTHISPYTFENCPGVTKVDLPSSVVAIDDHAFYKSSLSGELSIPNHVTSIGEYAYAENKGITSIYTGNGVTAIAPHAFENCSNDTVIQIGSGVKSIGECAFAGDVDITKVSIPENVNYIGDESFKNCTNLTTFEFVNCEFGKRVFDGCTALTKFTFPASFTAPIDRETFDGMAENVEIIIDPNNPAYKYSTDGNIMYYYGNPVKGFTTNTELTFDENTTYLPDGFFNGNKSIETIDFSKVKKITLGNETFAGCTALKSVNFGNAEVEIGESTFASCSHLESLTFGSGKVEIGKWAFKECNKLQVVDLGSGIVSIGDSAFYNCKELTLTSSNGSSDLYKFPESLRAIGVSAFEGCERITGISLETYYSIGDNAFKNCTGIKAVHLPVSFTMEHLNMSYFDGCSNMEKITVDPDNPYLVAHEGMLFVEKARLFDPLGHARFDPSGKIVLTM